MVFDRGDIVEYAFQIPDTGNFDPHPALIISTPDVYDEDECYICVMLTTSPTKDIFSFEIKDDMLVNPNNKPFAQARLHLVTYVMAKHIISARPYNRMKSNSVDRIVTALATKSLGIIS